MNKEKKHVGRLIVLTLVIVLFIAIAFAYAYYPDRVDAFKDYISEKAGVLFGGEGDEKNDSSTGVENKLTALPSSSADNAEATDTDKENADNTEVSEEEKSALMELYTMALAENEPVQNFELPGSEEELSLTLAKQALTMCMGGNKSGQASLLLNAGFEVILQYGYDKADSDDSHTCAFTVGKKTIDFYGEQKTLIFVAVRGTNAGEWFSNFNYADSHSDDTEFAENFLEAAQVINIKLVSVIAENPDALILISGHSRGAGAANLLGMTLDDLYGSNGIYVYTFATPNTYRGTEKDGKYTNIFNFINPADVVTELPLKNMGYHHIGKDIVLPCEEGTEERIAAAMNVLYETAPSISEYYETRHSLTKAGTDAEGYTSYEIMLALASSMTGIKTELNGGMNLMDVYEIMDAAPTGSESDFAPLIEQLSKIIGRDGSYGAKIYMQHMPAVYQTLIDTYAQILESLPAGADLSKLEGLEGMDVSMLEGLEGMDASVLEGLEGMDASVLEGFEGVDASMLEGFEGMDASMLESFEGTDTSMLEGFEATDASMHEGTSDGQ